MFSPYYAWAGRRAPQNHVAVNVALYGPAHRWAMTERGATALDRAATSFAVGPTNLTWTGEGLDIAINERCAPLPFRLRGTVRFRAASLTEKTFELSASGGHVWRPIAPDGQIEVRFTDPALAWSGRAYLDANAGAEPLEHGFRTWTWSRAHCARETLIFYEAALRQGGTQALALAIDPTGSIAAEDLNAFAAHQLPAGFWRIAPDARIARADPGCAPRRLEMWEDAPFYTRAKIATTLRGAPAVAVHEGLDLDRFANGVVRLMLPVRMPRRARAQA